MVFMMRIVWCDGVYDAYSVVCVWTCGVVCGDRCGV